MSRGINVPLRLHETGGVKSADHPQTLVLGLSTRISHSWEAMGPQGIRANIDELGSPDYKKVMQRM